MPVLDDKTAAVVSSLTMLLEGADLGPGGLRLSTWSLSQTKEGRACFFVRQLRNSRAPPQFLLLKTCKARNTTY